MSNPSGQPAFDSITVRACWGVVLLCLLLGSTPAAELETLPYERGGQDLLQTPFGGLGTVRWLTAGGEALRFSDVPVTLIRWWTDTCPYCEASLPALEKLRQRYADRGLVVVGIYHPKPRRAIEDEFVRRAASDSGFNGALAVDESWQLLERLWLSSGNRRATSVSFLVDRDGLIRFVHPGPELHPSDLEQHERCHDDFEIMQRAIDALLAAVPTQKE